MLLVTGEPFELQFRCMHSNVSWSPLSAYTAISTTRSHQMASSSHRVNSTGQSLKNQFACSTLNYLSGTCRNRLRFCAVQATHKRFAEVSNRFGVGGATGNPSNTKLRFSNALSLARNTSRNAHHCNELDLTETANIFRSCPHCCAFADVHWCTRAVPLRSSRI